MKFDEHLIRDVITIHDTTQVPAEMRSCLPDNLGHVTLKDERKCFRVGFIANSVQPLRD
jgi:hypothetical protein